jgi:hypothetical protein
MTTIKAHVSELEARYKSGGRSGRQEPFHALWLLSSGNESRRPSSGWGNDAPDPSATRAAALQAQHVPCVARQVNCRHLIVPARVQSGRRRNRFGRCTLFANECTIPINLAGESLPTIREFTQKAGFSFTLRQFPQSKTFFRLFSAILYAQYIASVGLEYRMHD